MSKGDLLHETCGTKKLDNFEEVSLFPKLFHDCLVTLETLISSLVARFIFETTANLENKPAKPILSIRIGIVLLGLKALL